MKQGDIVKIGEHQGTPGARNWFRGHFLSSETALELKTVTGQRLPLLRANGKSAAGKGDLVVGRKAELDVAASPYEHAFGLVELKT